MPIKAENKNRYPVDWKKISRAIRFDRAQNRCEFCGAENYMPHPETGSKVILTVAHLNHTPEDCNPENLRALCQRCHLNYDKEYHAHSRRRTAELKRIAKEPILLSA